MAATRACRRSVSAVVAGATMPSNSSTISCSGSKPSRVRAAGSSAVGTLIIASSVVKEARDPQIAVEKIRRLAFAPRAEANAGSRAMALARKQRQCFAAAGRWRPCRRAAVASAAVRSWPRCACCRRNAASADRLSRTSSRPASALSAARRRTGSALAESRRSLVAWRRAKLSVAAGDAQPALRDHRQVAADLRSAQTCALPEVKFITRSSKRPSAIDDEDLFDRGDARLPQLREGVVDRDPPARDAGDVDADAGAAAAVSAAASIRRSGATPVDRPPVDHHVALPCCDQTSPPSRILWPRRAQRQERLTP